MHERRVVDVVRPRGRVRERGGLSVGSMGQVDAVHRREGLGRVALNVAVGQGELKGGRERGRGERE